VFPGHFDLPVLPLLLRQVVGLCRSLSTPVPVRGYPLEYSWIDTIPLLDGLFERFGTATRRQTRDFFYNNPKLSVASGL